jgi:hypothetical protein
MMRAGTMLAAMLVILTGGATAHAKIEMRTFSVLAGAGTHDVYPAPDGRCGSLHGRPANLAVSIPELASRI